MTTFLLQIDTTYSVNSAAGFSLADYKDIATIAGVIIACATLIKGLFEYSYQGKQKRAEHFFNLRKKLKENAIFKKICFLIDTDSKELNEISFEDKRDFLGLFEEIAIMKNSGLVKKEISYYMFGYYAVRCWDSKNFWSSVNKESTYWKVFKDFVSEAKEWEQNRHNFNTDDIKI
jgi:hypothetical protein